MITPLFIVVSTLLQIQGDGVAGRIYWPPERAGSVFYEASFKKQRIVSKVTEAAFKKACKAAKLRRSGREPKQFVEVGMQIELLFGSRLKGKYKTTLGKNKLLTKFHRPKVKAKAVPPLDNSTIEAVWGRPSEKNRRKSVRRSASSIERSFSLEFQRKRAGGLASTLKEFGDHLLPVIWDHPLPCWASLMVDVMELNREGVVKGKSLIRDRTDHHALGSRSVRVELWFDEVDGKRVTLKYSMIIKLIVSKTRDCKAALKKGWVWRLEVKGRAAYSLADQAFIEIREAVTGRLHEPSKSGDKIFDLRDEEFKGSILIKRVPPPGEKKKKKKRRGR